MSDKTQEKIQVDAWPEDGVTGSKRTHLRPSRWLPDWFVGFGKDESCQFEGTWWDMMCFARNVLASKNTALVAPEFYKPEWKIHNYTGEEQPYEFTGEASGDV